MKKTINGGFICGGLLLGDHFCGNELKRQGHSREQHKDGIDHGGVAKAPGAEIPGHGNVVREIDSGVEPGAGKQDNTAGNDARLQRFSGLANRTYHRTGSPYAFLKGTASIAGFLNMFRG